MRVLLVDDDPRVLERHSALLTMHDVVKAVDATAALAELERQRFDVIVSDYAMPGMNGVGLLEIVAEKYPRVRRVLCSSAPPETKIAKVLKKPVTQAQLLAAIA